MTDITKCSNSECALNKNCRRFTDVSSDIKSVIRFEPTKVGCNFFLQSNGKKTEKLAPTKQI